MRIIDSPYFLLISIVIVSRINSVETKWKNIKYNYSFDNRAKSNRLAINSFGFFRRKGLFYNRKKPFPIDYKFKKILSTYKKSNRRKLPEKIIKHRLMLRRYQKLFEYGFKINYFPDRTVLLLKNNNAHSPKKSCVNDVKESQKKTIIKQFYKSKNNKNMKKWLNYFFNWRSSMKLTFRRNLDYNLKYKKYSNLLRVLERGKNNYILNSKI